MKLDNHIVNRLLKDPNLWTEMVISQAEADGVPIDSLAEGKVDNYVSLYRLLEHKDNKTYFVTKSVVEKLPLLDTKKCMDAEGWKIFSTTKDFKKTFILPEGNTCIRVEKKDGMLYFCHIDFTFHKDGIKRPPGDDGIMYWILLFVDIDEVRMAEHFQSEDGKRIAPFLYSLMCYVLLCENEEIEVKPKAKYGTQKQGKIINTLPFPITVINNTWNVTSVRSEGFWVSGHSAIYWTGPGRTIARLVFIEPYQKEGYTRRSGKQLHEF